MTTSPFARFLVDSQRTPTQWWLYKFPSGREASVVPDLHRPFHFEMEVSGDEDVTAGLTTAEVEAKLSELAQA